MMSHLVDGEHQLEYPVGRVLRRHVSPNSSGFALRVAPVETRLPTPKDAV